MLSDRQLWSMSPSRGALPISCTIASVSLRNHLGQLANIAIIQGFFTIKARLPMAQAETFMT